MNGGLTDRICRLGFAMLAAVMAGWLVNSLVHPATAAEDLSLTNRQFNVYAIGRVESNAHRVAVVLDKRFVPGLAGLDRVSHLWVLWWFDRNDTPQQRATLQVHPRGDRSQPLTGVFATRAPVRPNLIGLSLCKIKAVKDNVVELEAIDAFDKTPVLDLKPYAPGLDSAKAVGSGPDRGKPATGVRGPDSPP